MRKAGYLTALSLAMALPVAAQSPAVPPASDGLFQGMINDLGKLMPRHAPLRQLDNKIAPLKPVNPLPDRQNTAFDFYVLSLSWSPSFCAENGKTASARQQCGTGRHYAFIAHGLWPQYERGYPDSCSHNQANEMVPRDIVSKMSDIMPSAGLMRHQWRKHGTCSGLSQGDYFTTLHNAYQAVTVPPALRNVTGKRMVDPVLIEKAFIAANPGLPANAIAVTCSSRRLKEVRICMDHSLKFRSCPDVDRKSCRSRSVMLLPNR